MSKRSNPTKIDHFKSVFEERSGVQNFSLRHFSFSLGFSLALPPNRGKEHPMSVSDGFAVDQQRSDELEQNRHFGKS